MPGSCRPIAIQTELPQKAEVVWLKTDNLGPSLILKPSSSPPSPLLAPLLLIVPVDENILQNTRGQPKSRVYCQIVDFNPRPSLYALITASPAQPAPLKTRSSMDPQQSLPNPDDKSVYTPCFQNYHHLIAAHHVARSQSYVVPARAPSAVLPR